MAVYRRPQCKCYFATPFSAKAATHYCVNGNPMRLVLDDVYHRDETIVPRIPDEPTSKRMNSKVCRWDIEVHVGSHNGSCQQVVFQGLPAEEPEISQQRQQNESKAELVAQFKAAKRLVPFSGMMHVYPLVERRHFTVESNWEPREHSSSPPDVMLRVVLPVAGSCSRDMLSHRGNCYIIITARENFTAAVRNLGGDAKLASFTSMDQIMDFVSANYAKQTRFPYRKPLDLRLPLRVAIFNGQLMPTTADNQSCKLTQLKTQQSELSSTSNHGICGSLRLDESNRPVVEFGNCSQKLMSLVSFPQTIDNNSNNRTNTAGSSHECIGEALVNAVRRLNMSLQTGVSYHISATKETPNRKMKQSHLPSIPALPFLCGILFLFVITLLVAAMKYRVLGRCFSCITNAIRSREPKKRESLKKGEGCHFRCSFCVSSTDSLISDNKVVLAR